MKENDLIAAHQSIKAIDLLHDAMLKYHRDGEYTKLVQKLIRKLRRAGDTKALASLHKLFEDVVDHNNNGNDGLSAKIAVVIAPYESPKLASIEVNAKTQTKYIVEVPRRTANGEEWISQAEQVNDLIEDANREMKLIQRHINKISE